MAAVQMMCARIGKVTGQGLAGNFKLRFPRWLLLAFVIALLAANTINIAADLAGMADAAAMLSGINSHWFVVVFALLISWATVRLQYHQIASVLKWLVLVLFAYPITAFVVGADWGQVLRDTLVPSVPHSRGEWATLVAILGTTISPYLFFWQASQEVEEMNQGRISRPLRDLTRGGVTEIDRIAIDTSVGMIFSNVIAFFIILTTAAVLNAHGVTNINSATQAAEALRPLAGEFTFLLFALGIIGTGMLAIPVLAGSAAYGVSEAMGWPATLEARAPDAVGFYAIIAAATVIGFGLGFTGIDAIHMLVWSAVLNGVVAVPIMAMMMVIVANPGLMGRFRAGPWLTALGWIGTALMALAVVAMIWSFLAA